MADDAAKEQLNNIVSAIGFGIVSDFRDLRDAMNGFSAELQEGNRLIDQVTRETDNTGKSIDQFQKETFRRRDERQFKRLETQMERRAQLTGQRGEESMRRIASAIEGLQKKLSMGAVGAGGGDVDEDSIVDRVLNTIGAAGTTAVEVGAGAAGLGLAGMLLRGGLIAGGVAATGLAAYTAYNYFTGDEAEAATPEQAPTQPNLAPAPPASPPAQSSPAVAPAQTALPTTNLAPASAPQEAPPVPPANPPSPAQQLRPADVASGAQATPSVAGDVARMGAGLATTGAIATSVNSVMSLAQKTAQQKAVAKVASRVPSYLSKFGTRIVDTIGQNSVSVFGALVGGYFAFNRFMSGDNWTLLGADYVATGVAPSSGGTSSGPAEYLAGVTVTLAIETYLISRDIYNEENAIDIRNGVVPNFDDLENAEKTKVVKQVGNYVQNYVNSLISRASISEASTGVIPSSTSGSKSTAPVVAGSVAAAVAPTQAAGGAGAADTGVSQIQQMPGGGQPPTTFAGGPQAEVTPPGPSVMPGGGEPAPTFSTPGYAPSSVGASESQASSPSDTMASISTSSDLAGGYESGTIDTLKEEIARGEGDYGAYNRGTAGDTPRSRRSVDIQNLTVGQVMQMQSEGKLFAVGKYQFIPDTLAGAVSYAGVDPNQRFDASTQEQLFPYLISDQKRQVLSGYLNGGHDDVDAALNDLAAEFASIPQSNGRGRYDGDRAGNRAAGGLQRAEKIKGILKAIRNSKMSSTTSGTSGSEETTITAHAEGAKITPLSADTPKPGRDMSAELRPIAATSPFGEEDETMSSSTAPIDRRPKPRSVPDPVENKRNKISTYMPIMQHVFGTLSEEIRAHMSGEVTADKAFKDAMNPLG